MTRFQSFCASLVFLLGLIAVCMGVDAANLTERTERAAARPNKCGVCGFVASNGAVLGHKGEHPGHWIADRR